MGEGGTMKKVTNGDIGGGGSRIWHFSSDVILEWLLTLLLTTDLVECSVKSRLEVSLKKFKSHMYCALDIVEEMRLVICGKNKLQRNSYLVSLKRIFVTEIQSDDKICLFAYFYFGAT